MFPKKIGQQCARVLNFGQVFHTRNVSSIDRSTVRHHEISINSYHGNLAKEVTSPELVIIVVYIPIYMNIYNTRSHEAEENYRRKRYRGTWYDPSIIEEKLFAGMSSR